MPRLRTDGGGYGAERRFDGATRKTRERARDMKLPAEFRAIAAAPQITRADLAALIGIRLEDLLAAAPAREVVVTDITEHWAASWIAAVARAA